MTFKQVKGGGCHGCGMADVTLKQGIEKTLMGRVPGITAVRDATDHDSGQAPYMPRGSLMSPWPSTLYS